MSGFKSHGTSLFEILLFCMPIFLNCNKIFQPKSWAQRKIIKYIVLGYTVQKILKNPCLEAEPKRMD